MFSGQSIPWRGIRFATQSTWGGSWTLYEVNSHEADEFVQFLSVRSCAAPTLPECRVIDRSGKIKMEQRSEFQTIALSLGSTENFLRVDLKDEDDEWFTAFVGVRAGHEQRPMGGRVAADDYELTYYGMEYLLDRVRLYNGFAADADGYEVEIEHLPVFNERFERGLAEIGNRTSDKIEHLDDDLDPVLTHAFSEDEDVWTARDICEYLFAHYNPGGVRWAWDDEGQHSELEKIVPPRLDLHGLTVREALSRLIDRRRGLGWYVTWDTAVTQPRIRVFTHIDSAMSEGGYTVAANNQLSGVVYLRGIEQHPVLKVVDYSRLYGTIRVLGNRVRTMFSLSYDDAEIEKAWTADDATAYGDAAGATTQRDADMERSTDKFRHVYTTFVPTTAWAWQSYGGNAEQQNCNPEIGDDGEIYHNRQADIRHWNSARVFLDRLLIEKPSGIDALKPEYLEPFAVVEHPSQAGKFMLADKPSDSTFPPAGLRMLDSQMGVELSCNPNHAYAKGTTIAKTQYPPTLDYQTLIVTVAAETDERLKYVVEVEGGDVDKVLTIQVPDAHFWWIVPGTVTGVTAGALVRHSVTSDHRQAYPSGCAIRNDIERLREIASLAKAWYSRERSAVTWTVRDVCTLGIGVGWLVESVDVGVQSLQVATAVTDVLWDLTDGTTRFSTDYVELDFVER